MPAPSYYCSNRRTPPRRRRERRGKALRHTVALAKGSEAYALHSTTNGKECVLRSDRTDLRAASSRIYSMTNIVKPLVGKVQNEETRRRDLISYGNCLRESAVKHFTLRKSRTSPPVKAPENARLPSLDGASRFLPESAFENLLGFMGFDGRLNRPMVD